MTRVLTANLASGRDRAGRAVDAAGLAAAVAGWDADVVSVQECDTGQPRSHGVDQPAVLATALGAVDWRSAPTVDGTPGGTWRPVAPVALRGPGGTATGPRYGIALFSRRPVRHWHVLGLAAGRARLPIPDPATGRLRWFPDEPRAAVAAELDGLTVIAAHLSFAPHTAAAQLLRIRDWARRFGHPVLVAGDLNLAGPLPALLTGGTRLVSGPTYPAAEPLVQLDHLLSLGGLTGTDPTIRRLPISDHRALAVTVRSGS